MTGRLTDQERLEQARTAVTEALEAMRAGDKAEANQLFAHAAHAGVQPCELAAEIIDQTGGSL